MFWRLMKKILLLFFIIILFHSYDLKATPEFGEKTGYSCERCHLEPTGGKLTKLGEDYLRELTTKAQYRSLKPFQRIIRLIIGYLHILTAIAWFGTILYVHILLKPAYAAKGLPKGELVLGWICIIVLSITGILLTISRIKTLDVFYTTRFGILLGIKIILFGIMVTTAIIVTFIIRPKFKKYKIINLSFKKSKLTLRELSNFDGKEGRASYFAYKGKIYDASSSPLWKDGTHLKKHFAGNDLTEMLKHAPHGEEKIFQLPIVGQLMPIETKKEKSLEERAFYFMAYLNLILVFLITFIIALWRW